MTESERKSRCEAARRARARKRGENVPLLKSGPKVQDEIEIGKVFKKLRVIEFAGHTETNRPHRLWKCECLCGCKTTRVVRGDYLRLGTVSSCHTRALPPEEKRNRLEQPRMCRICRRLRPPSKYRGYKGFVCKRCERRQQLLKQYGLTLSDFDRMVEAQDGKCFICKYLPQEEDEVLFVDHHHLSGKVRKLLCDDCNSAIGYVRENPIIARAIADYIEFHSKIT